MRLCRHVLEGLGLVAGGLLVTWALPVSGAVEASGAEGFSAVAPAAALHSALQTNLKQVSDWLDEKDMLSAAQAAQELMSLAHLYQYESTEAGWRARSAALLEACSQLVKTAKLKDAAGCAKDLRRCAALLDDLAQNPPAGKPTVETAFKPLGSMKTWMLLLDGSYADAKTARSAAELRSLAYALAEEANATGHLRGDAAWRRSAAEVRDAALVVVEKAQVEELTVAWAALKNVYKRCEACHDSTRR